MALGEILKAITNGQAPGLREPQYFTLAEALRDPTLTCPPPAVIAPLAYEGRVTLLSAREKTGKSTLAGQAAAALSRGMSFLNPSERLSPGGVLWYGIDEPTNDTVRRLVAFGAHEDMVRVSPDAPTAAQLGRAIETFSPRLVVFDTLADLLARNVENEKDSVQVSRFLRPFISTVRATRAALLFLHHTSKAGREYRGASALGGMVDALVTMRRTSRPVDDTVRQRFADHGNPDDRDDGDDVDDGRRTVTLRGRWGLETLKLDFDGSRYSTGSSALPLRLRLLRAIAEGRADTISALRDLHRVRKEVVVAEVRGLIAEGAVSRGQKHLEITPFGVDLVNGKLGSVDGSSSARVELDE